MHRFGCERRAGVAAGVGMCAVLGLALVTGCGSGQAPAPNPAPDPSIPGVNPSVQEWMASRDPVLLALDDALGAVRPLLGQPPPGADAGCERLGAAAAALLAMPAAPVAELRGPALAGLDEFSRGAAACRAGDYGAASGLIAEGADLRATASLELDMALMGIHGHQGG